MECKTCYSNSIIESIQMKVLVTGSSGFIGQYVLQELSLINVEVIAIHKSKSKKLKYFKNVRYFLKDINNIDKEFYEEIGSPKILIHLAWGNLPNYDSEHHTNIELPIQINFLKKMVLFGLQNILISGTCFEYGNGSGCLNEKQNLNPLNNYARAKVELLNYLIKLKKDNNFKYTWARLFYMYGDGQNPASLWPQLKKAVQEKKLSFSISGEQLRDYLHVKEVAKIIVKLILKDSEIGVVNICSGKPLKIKDLVESWISDNDWKIKITSGYQPIGEFKPLDFWGNDTKLSAVL